MHVREERLARLRLTDTVIPERLDRDPRTFLSPIAGAGLDERDSNGDVEMDGPTKKKTKEEDDNLAPGLQGLMDLERGGDLFVHYHLHEGTDPTNSVCPSCNYASYSSTKLSTPEDGCPRTEDRTKLPDDAIGVGNDKVRGEDSTMDPTKKSPTLRAATKLPRLVLYRKESGSSIIRLPGMTLLRETTFETLQEKILRRDPILGPHRVNIPSPLRECVTRITYNEEQ